MFLRQPAQADGHMILKLRIQWPTEILIEVFFLRRPPENVQICLSESIL